MRTLCRLVLLIFALGGSAHAQKISQFTNEPGNAALPNDAVVTESQNCPLSNGQPGNCRTTIQQIINTPGSAYYAPIGTGITWGQISGAPTTLTGYGVPTTGSGNAVQATSPSLVTPALGTPSALVLTNATSLPCAAMPALTGSITSSAGSCATSGGSILWSQIGSTPTTLTGYGVPVTGTGTAVQATSPTLVTPVLGTPTSINLTNATALPCSAMPALTGAITTSAGSCATTGSGLGTPVTTTGAGTTQGTARAITANVTIFTTVTAGQGGILTMPYSTVINAGANPLLVYPNSGATITGGGTTLSTNAAFTIGAGSSATFACSSSTACYATFSSFQ